MRVAAAVVLVFVMLSLAIISVAASATFYIYVEARRDQERKEQFEKFRTTIESSVGELTDKIPDFNFFKRKEAQPHGSPGTHSAGRLARFVGR